MSLGLSSQYGASWKNPGSAPVLVSLLSTAAITLLARLGGMVIGCVFSQLEVTTVAVQVYITVLTNTVPVPMTTGTVTDSGSV